MAAINFEQLENAAEDAETLGDFVNGPAATITPREGDPYPSVRQLVADSKLQIYGAPSWAALAAIVPTQANAVAEVLGDMGSHNDPVTDQAVSNSGRFVFVPGADNGWQRVGDVNEAGRAANYGVRSPFQPTASFVSAGLAQESVWRKAIIDVALPGIAYDPALFYSFAEITKAANRIDFNLYSQTTPTGGYVLVRVFTLLESEGYDPASMNVQRIDTNVGSIAFVPGLIPEGYSGNMYWASFGLDEHVFREGYGLVARTAGLDPVVADPATHIIGGGYVSEYAYRHPNEPAEHAGELSFPNPGLGQYYNFTTGKAVKRIITAMYNSAGQVFKGKVRVMRKPALIPGVTADAGPIGGTLVQEFVFPEGFYPSDFALELDKIAYFEAGEAIAVYIVPDAGYQINMRYWDHPRAGQPNPNGRLPLLYGSAFNQPWSFGSATADYAYWQVPLILETNLIGRDQVEELVGGLQVQKPRIVLPSYVHAVVGRELNLYYDAISLLPESGLGAPQFLFDVQCAIGTAYKRSYRVTPSAAQVGDHILLVLVYDNQGKVIDQASTTLRVVAATNPATVKRILCLGDSTTDDTGVVTKTFQENLAALGGNVPVFIGTHGQAPYNMEARSGQTMGYYAYGGGLRYRFTITGFPNVPFWPFWLFTGMDGSGYILAYEETTINGGGAGTVVAVVAQSPNGQNIVDGWTGQLKLGNAVFNVTATQAIAQPYSILKTNGTGVLSFAAYMQRFGFPSCDLLSIDLGINDSRGPLQSENDQLAKIAAAKAVIDSYLAYNPVGKVMICLPKSGASTINGPATGTQHDSYRLNIHRLRELIIKNFDYGAYGPNVAVCASGLTIDRYYGYPLLDAQPVAARIPNTETIHGDYVHPRAEGYYQVADAMTGTALALLA